MIHTIAYQIILFYFNLLGVTPFNTPASSEWQILKQWQDNGSQYEMTADGTHLIAACRRTPNQFINFPTATRQFQERPFAILKGIIRQLSTNNLSTNTIKSVTTHIEAVAKLVSWERYTTVSAQ